jgi:SAM-dependent methyltransferase
MTLYAEPRAVPNVENCFFYHRMEVPGAGLVGGHWDLRTTIGDYLASHPFQGKRVLDVGAASGFPTFEMEKRGAEVVSFDMAPDGRWDVVPVAGWDVESALQSKRQQWTSLTNAYWFAHAALASRARAFYGDIYNLPDQLGTFDVVFLGSVLLHLRDPFAALQSAARRTHDTLIVTDMSIGPSGPQMEFVPTRQGPGDTWWRLSESCVTQMLDVLGFDVSDVKHSRHLSTHESEPRMFDFYSIVGKRSTSTS